MLQAPMLWHPQCASIIVSVTLATSISYTDQVPEYSNTSNNTGLHGQNKWMKGWEMYNCTQIILKQSAVQGERPTTMLALPSNKKTHNSSGKTSITRKPEHIYLQKPYWQGQRSAYKEYYTLLTPNQQSRPDQNMDNRRTGNSMV